VAVVTDPQAVPDRLTLELENRFHHVPAARAVRQQSSKSESQEHVPAISGQADSRG